MELKSSKMGAGNFGGNESGSDASAPLHVLPPLPYDYAALEPVIDARTMTLHHDKHHATYVDKLNAALEPYAELRRRSVPWLLMNSDAVPEPIRAAVRNNGGGHLNHSLFWRLMTPTQGGAPTGVLADAVKKAFGSLEEFRTRFDDAGAKLFGSGWVWLVIGREQGSEKPGLEIVTTTGHDNPIQQGKYPLLLNDVWEHAYYLKYENRRPDYLKSWWDIVNWKEVASRFETPEASTELEPADGYLPATRK
ncbi:MAG: superoxide dismutase [Betaproteobacteria bacterium]